MRQLRALFVSGAISLGHAVRDLAIARAPRARAPELEIDWLAGGAARQAIAAAGERLLPEAERYTAGNPTVESAASGFSLNLTSPRFLLSARGWRAFARFRQDVAANVRLFAGLTAPGDYDLLVGDGTYELLVAIAREPRLKTAPFALIVDFVGVDATTRNPLDRLAAALLNRAWANLLRRPSICDRILFVGELEDVDDRPLVLLLPSRREAARRAVDFLGYVCDFEPAELGQLDNTLVFYIVGDNGASAEGGMAGMFNEMTYFNGVPETVASVLKHYDELGGPSTYGHYAAGWAVAGDTPFTWTKQVASSYGGTRNGLVVHWPKGIKARNEIRSQWHHVIDVAPTILEAAHLPEPKLVDGVAQVPIEGVSMLPTFGDAKAPERHLTQYFEIFGNGAVYSNGWLAGTVHQAAREQKPRASLDKDVWELYDTRADFSLANDLAAKRPAKLAQMQEPGVRHERGSG